MQGKLKRKWQRKLQKSAMKHLMKKEKRRGPGFGQGRYKRTGRIAEKADRKQGPNRMIEAENRAELIDPVLKEKHWVK